MNQLAPILIKTLKEATETIYSKSQGVSEMTLRYKSYDVVVRFIKAADGTSEIPQYSISKIIAKEGRINVILKIDWKEPIIQESDVMQIQPSDLDGFYVSSDNFDKTNLFFVLLTSFHHYLDKRELGKAAHLSFLMAYYLFITLTPPGSSKLAMHYIKQAISLNPLEEYKEWLSLMNKGN